MHKNSSSCSSSCIQQLKQPHHLTSEVQGRVHA